MIENMLKHPIYVDVKMNSTYPSTDIDAVNSPRKWYDCEKIDSYDISLFPFHIDKNTSKSGSTEPFTVDVQYVRTPEDCGNQRAQRPMNFSVTPCITH